MLKMCESMGELAFMQADPYAAKISALAETYGFNQSFVLFWVQYIDDIPVAAISRIDGNMSIYCTEKADFSELSVFADTVGFLFISCQEEVALRLGFKAEKSSYIVEYKGGAASSDRCVFWDYDKKSVYALLKECGFEMGDYGSFLADYCSKLNKGAAMLAAVAGDELYACASALFIGEKSVLLGAVATKEAARGRGYASKAVSALAGRLCEKSVYLFCRNDSLLDFYKKIGFEYCGKWAEVRRE